MNVGIRHSGIVQVAELNDSDEIMVDEIINYIMSLEKRKRKYRGSSTIGKERGRNIADALEHMASKLREHIQDFVDANWIDAQGFDDENFHNMADILNQDLDVRQYSVINFMLNCCRISLLASIMYDYEFNKAPLLAKQRILFMIQWYKNRNMFDESKWKYLNSAMFHYLVDNDVLE